MKLIFLEENAIGIQRLSYGHKYVLEIEGLDFSRNFTIIFNEGSVNGTNIWGVFVTRELQPDLKQKFIDLGIKFYTKKWHFFFFIYNLGNIRFAYAFNNSSRIINKMRDYLYIIILVIRRYLFAWRSNFNAFHSGQEEDEMGGLVFFLFPVREDSRIIEVAVLRCVDTQVFPFFVWDKFDVFSCSIFELFDLLFCWSLFLHFIYYLFSEPLELLLPVLLFKWGLLVAKGINKIVDFLNGGSSGISLILFFLILSSKSVSTAHINFNISLDNHSASNLDDRFILFEYYGGIGVGDDLSSCEDVLVNLHFEFQQSD